MEWTRTAVLGALGVTLVTLLARASTSVAPEAASAAPPPSSAREPAVVTPHVARLREHAAVPAAPATPARDLFAFGPTTAPARAAAPPTSVAPVTAAPPPPAAAFQLIGIADETGDGGRGRTAIVTDARGLHFLNVGDVLDGFRVAAVRADGVDLTGAVDQAPIALVLK